MNIAPAQGQTNPILDLITRKLLPRIEEMGMGCCAIARPSADELVVPSGMEVTRKKMSSERIAVKGDRPYGNSTVTTARWLEEHQETTRSPSLTCVVSGKTDLRLGDYILHCGEGYFVFIPAGIPHPDGQAPHLEGENRINGSCDLLSICLRGEKVQCWVCHSRGSEHIGPAPGENIYIVDEQPAQILSMLIEEVQHNDVRHRKIYESLLRTLLLMLQREMKEGRILHLQNELPEVEEPASPFDPIEHARDYVRTHLNYPLTLENMARLVFMSRAQFAKRFHEKTGETFVVFVNRCRMEQARAFLRETNLAVPLIAEIVGYKSASYFYRLFQRENGVSPMDYRRDCEEQRKQSSEKES